MTVNRFFREGRNRAAPREKAQPDERCCLESAGGKLRVARRDLFVKARHALVELGADAANEEIAERRQAPEQKHGAVLDLAVRLGQRGQGEVALIHGRRSAAVYSGSVSP